MLPWKIIKFGDGFCRASDDVFYIGQSDANFLEGRAKSKKPNLDIELIKESLLAHYNATGEWLISAKKGEDGKPYILEHGYYAGKIKARALNAALSIDGLRGLEGKSSIAQLNKELKAELVREQALALG